MSVMEVSDFSIVLLLGNVEVAQAAIIWAQVPPIGMYRTAVVHHVRSLCVGNQVMVYVPRKRTL